jgi:hypothetical protein
VRRLHAAFDFGQIELRQLRHVHHTKSKAAARGEQDGLEASLRQCSPAAPLP